MGYFPEYGDPNFRERLMELEEYQMFQVPPMGPVKTLAEYETRVSQFCTGFEKTLYQHLMQHYLSYRSPYRSLLLYHGLGVGKTCSAITIAESLLVDHSARDAARIWVILPTTLQDSFREQLFSSSSLLDADKMLEQCTQDTYDRLAFGTVDEKRAKIDKLIKTRYKMMTYEKFAKKVEKLKEKGTLQSTLTNKVLIVDEAHNLRIEETDKRAATALMDVARECTNNRIVLLSATPMYNEPNEIFWLLSLLLANDKRDAGELVELTLPNKKALAKLKELASEYISYIRGVNPFTFASRLSPSVNGERMLKDPWCASIKDGIVPTKLGEVQLAAIASLPNNNATLQQGNNVCYPGASDFRVGKQGFDSVLGRENDTAPYRYKTGMPRVLLPTDDMLGKYGAKLKHITDCIRQAEGIIVVYSQFVWGGIVPLAVALEHMGFMRYGTRNLLADSEVGSVPRATYPGIPFPTYCIFSGDTTIMGSTSIDDLVKDVNNANNIRGERIKVVLMSPIAGEGLSLKNVREIHVMDPWYHMNRIQQVVGRAIRTCSHTALPVQQRNVVVYLHAAVTDGKEDTIDIHSYKIAARKSAETQIAEAVIRDNAIDCPLVKNVHYYPRALFEFDIMYHTSRGKEVPYHFGDDLSEEPKCKLPLSKDSTTMRSEVVAELVPTGLQRLRQFLRPQKDVRVRYQEGELLEALRYPTPIAKVVLKKACVPDVLFRGYALQKHRDEYVMRTPPSIVRPTKLRVGNIKTVAAVPDATTMDVADTAVPEAFVKLLETIPTSNPSETIIRIYLSLDDDIWPKFAKYIILNGVPPSIQQHINILAAEGALVMGKEIRRSVNGVVGFFDLYHTDTPNIILWDEAKKSFRNAVASETSMILSHREHVPKPKATLTSLLFGSMEPHKHKSQEATRLVFKLFNPDPSSRGIVCINEKKENIRKGLEAVSKTLTDQEFKKETKDTLCTLLSYLLKEKQRLYLPPYYPVKKA